MTQSGHDGQVGVKKKIQNKSYQLLHVLNVTDNINNVNKIKNTRCRMLKFEGRADVDKAAGQLIDLRHMPVLPWPSSQFACSTAVKYAANFDHQIVYSSLDNQ